MKTNKTSFIMYVSWYEAINQLTDENAGLLLKAIMKYHSTGEIPNIDNPISFPFNFLKPQMDHNWELYDKICERNKLNGSKGGRPLKTQNNPNNPLGFLETQKTHWKHDNDIDIDIDSDNDIDNDIDRKEKFKKENSFKIINEDFENFRLQYPGTKRGYEIEFENFKKKNADWEEILPILSERLKYQNDCRFEKAQNGGFVPEWKNLSTWINQKCWDEEIQIYNVPNEKHGKQQGVTDYELAQIVAKHCGTDSPEQK